MVMVGRYVVVMEYVLCYVLYKLLRGTLRYCSTTRYDRYAMICKIDISCGNDLGGE